MLPNVEVSPESLIMIRIAALEMKFDQVRKTIDYPNKVRLEIELAKAYKKLMTLVKKRKHNVH
jgi:hypothetical protein